VLGTSGLWLGPPGLGQKWWPHIVLGLWWPLFLLSYPWWAGLCARSAVHGLGEIVSGLARAVWLAARPPGPGANTDAWGRTGPRAGFCGDPLWERTADRSNNAGLSSWPAVADQAGAVIAALRSRSRFLVRYLCPVGG